MTSVNELGYVCRRTTGMRGRAKRLPQPNPQNYRHWWLGKRQIVLGTVCLPQEYVGKRIMFKVVVVDD